MPQFLMRRLLELPVTLLLITIMVFTLIHATPGDPVAIALGVYASPEAIEAMRRDLHLDLPLIQQYSNWVINAFQGDFGKSIHSSESVTQIITERFPISVTIAILSMAFSLAIAIPIGVISGYKRNSKLDYFFTLLSMGGLSIPNFSVALVLIFVFASKLGWIPIIGQGGSIFEEPLQYILPVISLSFIQIAVLSRFLRSSIIEVLSNDFIRTARAKGLRNGQVLKDHALRNALMPLVTVAAVNFAHLLGSTITIEYIFAIPGLGTAMLDAVKTRDFPVVQGITLFVALFFIAANLLADIAYSWIDPRIRL